MVRLGGFLAPNMDVPADAYRPIDKKVVDFIAQPSIHILSDLDDAIGGEFQMIFWDQLKLLWTDPSTKTMNNVLDTLHAATLYQQGIPEFPSFLVLPLFMITTLLAIIASKRRRLNTIRKIVS